MDRAKEILQKEPQIRIADLAEKVGYEEPKYFARLFQQDTGYSCSEYAEQKSF